MDESKEDITFEYRFAEQKSERLPELVADLVRLKADLIVVVSDATSVSGEERDNHHGPIVMANAGDPVAAGLVASLAWPGGNVTGLSGLSTQLNTKRLEVPSTQCRSDLPSRAPAAEGDSIANGAATKSNLSPPAVALKLKLEEIEDSTRRQRFRERLSNRKAERDGRDDDDY